MGRERDIELKRRVGTGALAASSRPARTSLGLGLELVEQTGHLDFALLSQLANVVSQAGSVSLHLHQRGSEGVTLLHKGSRLKRRRRNEVGEGGEVGRGEVGRR